MSKNIVLDVENVSKQYRLGEVGTGSLQHDIVRWWANIRGQEDPYLKIGDTNDRTQKGVSDYVWALKDINFQVEQGQAVGIIGRNGAGKSTLLKLLSRVTKPTTGSIKYKGRIASLLEVGTGFHPEMTGRENIYLNGAILGMTRKEITRKFDEIVDFAGVERYIDTPVKRYSSGMYVRLAFAVAAHLESEILIVDEVLAVGDAEFQKKCLGKMGDVSKGEGRTVLFVSHNMASVEKLCESGVYLKNGTVDFVGRIGDVIDRYMNTGLGDIIGNRIWKDEKTAPGNDKIKILEFTAKSDNQLTPNIIDTESSLKLGFKIKNYREGRYLGFNAQILDQFDSIIFTIAYPIASGDSKEGIYNFEAKVPYSFLNQGMYKVKVWFGERGSSVASFDDNMFQFEVMPKMTEQGVNPDRLPGVVLPNLEYSVTYL